MSDLTTDRLSNLSPLTWAPACGPLQPERLARAVTILLSCFGLIQVFLVPPCMPPDEWGHLLRAYDLSEGHLWPSEKSADEPGQQWGGASMPSGLLDLVAIAKTRLEGIRNGNKASYREVLANARLPLRKDQRKFIGFACHNIYTFVPYMPQAFGILLARLMGGGPLLLLYAGRLANLLFVVVVINKAIHVLPAAGAFVGALVFLPVALHVAASLSGDASVICSCLLLTAILIRLRTDDEYCLGLRRAIVLCVLAAWVALCKIPYTALLFLYVGIPRQRIGSVSRYAIVGVFLVLVVSSGVSYTRWIGDEFVPRKYEFFSPVDRQAQIAVVRDRPLRFLRISTDVFCREIGGWLTSLGILGPWIAPLHPVVLGAFLGFLVLVGLSAGQMGLVLPFRFRIIGICAPCISVGLILLFLYVAWTPVGSGGVAGFQGRYLVPVFPCLLFAIYNRRVYLDRLFLSALWLGACVGIQFGSILAILECCYLGKSELVCLFLPLGAAIITGWVAIRCRINIFCCELNTSLEDTVGSLLICGNGERDCRDAVAA